MTPQTIRAIAVLTGATLVSAGTGMIYPPYGMIVGGVLLLAMGLIGHIRGGEGE
jgi:hypothetical protein